MKEKAYITGSNGFIGSHLLKELLNVTPIPHELIQKQDYADATRFYFLSTYGNMSTHTDDTAIMKANVGDLLHVLKTIDFSKIDSFVYVSSSSVKLQTQTMYSRAKRAAEEILLSFAEKYNAPVCIIRPFSVTGVGEQKAHLIPTLIRSCFTNSQMDFVPDPVHDFIDVDDLIEGILTLSERHSKGVFELGTAEAYSNQLVKEMVEEVTNKRANVREVRYLRSYDNANWVSQNMRARSTGWTPKKTLRQSIEEMVKDYEQTRKTDN